ncbi:dienelactone hydrolase family protein [Zobellella maritima]|uniref:dienelactone hydrolase family protein n=1 Tax=Zobellella maritima TaxID=2059725 RepID=UPI000E302ED8|nr:dienelactone hydrolase family protein [Zobellella maritima]
MSKQRNTPDIPAEAFELYDRYAHGYIDRRQFLTGLGRLALGGMTALALFNALKPDYARAQQVSFNDPDIVASYRTFDSPDGHGEGRGYLVQPREWSQPAGTVLVVHENRGLNPYIEDVARRLAKAGLTAFAPDALHPLGGYPGNDDDGRALQQQLDADKLTADFFAATRFLHSLEGGNGKLGVVGFCFGGGMANRLAAEQPQLVSAAVPFYGMPPALEKVADIRAALLIQMAENDERINGRWPAYEQALQRHGVRYQAFSYPGTQHGFHNDSTPRYHPEAAELAWSRTLGFFGEHLGG